MAVLSVNSRLNFAAQVVAPATVTALGTGPTSGYPYWTGAWWRTVAGYSPAEQETALGLTHDIYDQWVAYSDPHYGIGQMATIQDELDWIAGGAGALANTAAGVFTPSWKQIWTTNFLSKPMKLNMVCFGQKTANCKGAFNAGATYYNNADAAIAQCYKVFYDILAGDYDVYYQRLGLRWAYKDRQSGRNCFPATGQRLAVAHTFVLLNWECNDSQFWSYFNIKTPPTASTVTTNRQGQTITAGRYPNSTYISTAFGAAMCRVARMMKQGYRSYTGWADGLGRDCPYFFGLRPTERAGNNDGRRFRDVMDTLSAADAAELHFIGQSAHHTEQAYTPTDPYAGWDDVGTPPNYGKEGLNSLAYLCRKYNWFIRLDEYGQNFGAHTAATIAGAYPDYYIQGIHDFMITNDDIAGGVQFYAGDRIPNTQPVSCTCLTPGNSGVTLGNTQGGNPRWQQASDTWIRLYKADRAGTLTVSRVDNWDMTGSISSGTFTVTPPTDAETLIMVVTARRGTSGSYNPKATIGIATGKAKVTEKIDNFSSGQSGDILTWAGMYHGLWSVSASRIVTFDAGLTMDGCNIDLFWIKGTRWKSNITVFATQKVANAATNTIGLSITPGAASSMVIASYLIAPASAATLSSFTAGWTTAKDGAVMNGNCRKISKYRLSAGAAAITPTAVFSQSTTAIGGMVLEIRQ